MNDYTQNIINADFRHMWHPFTQMQGWLDAAPVVVESARGFTLVDTEGREYIDGFSSLWCNVHGHQVPEIDDAVRDQLGRVAHSTLLGLGQTRSIELAERLAEIAPAGLERVFYSDSGATSVEIAVKMAFQYYRNLDKARSRFIALGESYHGDTIGSVSIGGIDLFHGIFHPLLFEADFVPSPHPYRFEGTPEKCRDASLDAMENLLKQHAGNVAAIIVEPLVQGAAGIIVHPEGFLKGAEKLARKYDTLLIVDEVATGFGRTGKMFACEHEGVTPDLMCLAKGITGGYLPLAVTMTTEKIFEAFLGDIADQRTFYHGHTYTGNALGCAAAIASLYLFEKNRIIESLPEKIKLIESRLAKFAGLDFVGDVRNCGLMCGIELVADKQTKQSFDYTKTIGVKLCAAMRPRGAMMRPLGDVIVLMPPPAMDIPTLTRLLDILEAALAEDLPKILEDKSCR